MTDDGKTTGWGRYTSQHTPTGKPSRPQNLFEFILSVIFFVPVFLAVAACMIATIILFPVIWLVEGRRGKLPPPDEVAPPPARQTLPTPASEVDARSLEIQDQIEAKSRQIAWERIRAANAKTGSRSLLDEHKPGDSVVTPGPIKSPPGRHSNFARRPRNRAG